MRRRQRDDHGLLGQPAAHRHVGDDRGVQELVGLHARRSCRWSRPRPGSCRQRCGAGVSDFTPYRDGVATNASETKTTMRPGEPDRAAQPASRRARRTGRVEADHATSSSAAANLSPGAVGLSRRAHHSVVSAAMDPPFASPLPAEIDALWERRAELNPNDSRPRARRCRGRRPARRRAGAGGVGRRRL